jgi:hypothetical protein
MLDREMDDWTDLVEPEMLTRRLTLDEYFAEHVEWVRKGHITQAAVDQNRAQLEARWQPGDEWWEWIMGTEKLMQMGGLALVRGGQIAWARNDWIS